MNNTLDWNKLFDFVKERNPVEVHAGLLNDWFWTSATVYKEGEWVKDHRAYLTSNWATPGFKAVMENGDMIEVVASKEQNPDEYEIQKKDIEERKLKMKEILEKIRSAQQFFTE